LHGGIIHNHRELIGRHVIVPPHDEITEIFARDKVLLAVVAIDERNGFAIGNAEAPACFLEAGFWIRDARCWMLDAGCWMFGLGLRV
jgi:hypothetical protein